MICIVSLNCGHKVVVTPIPYDRQIFDMNIACTHPDKNVMVAIYSFWLEELFADLSMCREKGLLKEEGK